MARSALLLTLLVVSILIGGGMASRAAHASNLIVTLDSAGDVGRWSSLELDSSGRPVVAYWSGSGGDLKIVRCGDAMCSGGNTIMTPDSDSAIGLYASLELDSLDRPVVSYYDQSNGDLKVLRCGDATCSSGNTIVSPDTAGDVGTFTSLALDSAERPVVSYIDETADELKVLRCGDATCSNANVITVVDSGHVSHTTIALDSTGKPYVGYRADIDAKFEILHCGNVFCSASNTIEPVLGSGSLATAGSFGSLSIGPNGYPVASVSYETTADLNVVRCTNASCSTRDVSAPDVLNFVGSYTSLAVGASGNPVVSYYDATNFDLKVLHCANAACFAPNTIVAPDTLGSVGTYTSIALTATGSRVVSYYDQTNADLKILFCGAVCEAGAAVGGFTELPLIDPSGDGSANWMIFALVAGLALAVGAGGASIVTRRRRA